MEKVRSLGPTGHLKNMLQVAEWLKELVSDANSVNQLDIALGAQQLLGGVGEVCNNLGNSKRPPIPYHKEEKFNAAN